MLYFSYTLLFPINTKAKPETAATISIKHKVLLSPVFADVTSLALTLALHTGGTIISESEPETALIICVPFSSVSVTFPSASVLLPRTFRFHEGSGRQCS